MRGRKRHYLLDVEGYLLLVLVEPVDEDDCERARWMLWAGNRRWPRLELIRADQNYTADLESEAQAEYGIRLESVQKPAEQQSCRVLPRLRVVERTIARQGCSRWMSRDYEGHLKVLRLRAIG